MKGAVGLPSPSSGWDSSWSSLRTYSSGGFPPLTHTMRVPSGERDDVRAGKWVTHCFACRRHDRESDGRGRRRTHQRPHDEAGSRNETHRDERRRGERRRPLPDAKPRDSEGGGLGGGRFNAPSSARRTSPMSRTRCLGFSCRHPRRTVRTGGGVSVGSTFHRTSDLMTLASTTDASSPSKGTHCR